MTGVRVLNCLHRNHPGGAHWRVAWVAQRLAGDGIDTTVLFPTGPSDVYGTTLDRLGLPYAQAFLPAIRRSVASNAVFMATLPWVVIRLAVFFRSRRFDLVHVNGATNLAPVLAAGLLGVPVTWHFNDMETPQWFVRRLVPLLRRPGVRLLVATEAILAHYQLDGDPNIAWTRMPAPAPAVGSRSDGTVTRASLEIAPSDHVVGFIGNLVPVKGAADFLEAVVPLLREDTTLHAVLVGPPVPAQEGYARMLRTRSHDSGCEHRIHFVGYQPNVADWLAQFDVFVFPSYSEACPIAMLEAMQAGLPLVATAVGEVPRMLEGTDVPLVRPGDVQAIRKGVQRMLGVDSPARRRLADALRERVANEYTLDVVTSLHRHVYTALLAPKTDGTARPER